jgi:hypothetical protein
VEKRKLFYFIVALTNVLITSNMMGFRALSNSRMWTFESNLLFWGITFTLLIVANTALYLHFRKNPLFAQFYNTSKEDRIEATKTFFAHSERVGFVLMMGLSVPWRSPRPLWRRAP